MHSVAKGSRQTMQTQDPKYIDLLIGNLKETFKAIEKFY
jgi:hypothetical protein